MRDKHPHHSHPPVDAYVEGEDLARLFDFKENYFGKEHFVYSERNHFILLSLLGSVLELLACVLNIRQLVKELIQQKKT